MGNIVKREKQGESNPLVRRETSQLARDPFRSVRDFARDPFQAMRDLMQWDPFREMAPLWTGGWRRWSPDFEVRETKDAYVFKADMPGASKDDIDVSLVGNRLQVTGKREEEEEEETRDDTYFAYERSYGSFTRSFTLPDTADTEHITSDLRNGVLTLVVPKKAESQARKIPIGVGEKH